MSDLPDNLRRPRLRRALVPEYLELKFGWTVAKATLAKMAGVGGGPPFNKVGRIPVYPVEELDKWALERTGPLFKSTSDPGDGSA